MIASCFFHDINLPSSGEIQNYQFTFLVLRLLIFIHTHTSQHHKPLWEPIIVEKYDMFGTSEVAEEEILH